ncbi:MAG: hypothetical protein J5529_02395 [Prevotella sp.]|nr:hypothetical protein [Prevotella sp.]
MSTAVIFATVLLYTLLTVAYIRGIKMVERHAPDKMVVFHFIMVAVRFAFTVTAVGLFMLFSHDREQTMRFAAMVLVLYLAMMVVTLIFKILK